MDCCLRDLRLPQPAISIPGVAMPLSPPVWFLPMIESLGTPSTVVTVGDGTGRVKDVYPASKLIWWQLFHWTARGPCCR